MTQENKELLLKDLSARLPYGVKAQYGSCFGEIKSICTVYGDVDITIVNNKLNNRDISLLENIKPYLRPMSSMTEEEEVELNNILPCGTSFSYATKGELITYTDQEYDCDYFFSSFAKIQDWLNEHHFDFRGLIEKGLALEAPEGMYKF